MNKTITQPERRRLFRSGFIGAGVFLALFAFSLLFHGGFSVLGVADDRLKIVIDILKNTFPLEITLFALRIAALHLLVGFLLGLWAGLIARRAWAVTAIVAGLHALFYLRQIVLTPALYAEFWLAKGGAHASTQIFLTDNLSPVWPVALLAAAALLAVWRGRSVFTPRRVAAAVLIAGVSAAVYSMPNRATATMKMERPNILLIGIDSLRSDRITANGYARDTTPNIDNLIARGTIFTNAYAAIPRTFPSWVSILTGATPPLHGVRSMFPVFEDRAFLPEPVPSWLARSGYATAVVADYAGDIFPRVDLGFQSVKAPDFTILTLAQLRLAEMMTHLFPYIDNRVGRRVLPILWEFANNANPAMLTAEALSTIDDLRKTEPFFLTVFYSTTHFPFASPYPYYKRYADLSYRGPHRYHKYTIVGRKETTTASDERQVGDLYDGALRAVDEQVGRLLDELERRGLADNTIVFLFGDHGEDLYESPDIPVIHGEQLRSEYSPKTALVVAGPNIPRGRRIDARIPMIDLAPTVAWYAGMPLRAPEGQSLAPLIDGTESGDRPVFIETGLWYALEGNGFYQQRRLPYPDVTAILEVDPEDNHEIVLQKQWAALTNAAKHQAVILDDWKLIRMPLVEGDAFELYDLDADPECRNDLAAGRPDKVAELAEVLRAHDEMVAEARP